MEHTHKLDRWRRLAGEQSSDKVREWWAVLERKPASGGEI